MPAITAPCPNGGKCGSKTHDPSKQQYQICSSAAWSQGGTTARPGVTSPPRMTQGQNEQQDFSELAGIVDAHAKASNRAYEARKQEVVSAVTMAVAGARAICPKTIDVAWVDNPDAECTNVHARCGCGNLDGFDDASWDEFVEAHEESSMRKLPGRRGTLSDLGDMTLDTSEVDVFHDVAGLVRVRGGSTDGRFYDDSYVYEMRDEYLAAIGVTGSNPEAFAYIINAEPEWWNLSEDSPEIQNAKMMFPDRES